MCYANRRLTQPIVGRPSIASTAAPGAGMIPPPPAAPAFAESLVSGPTDCQRETTDRPLAFSGGIRPSGGGRVTEILIRPLFSLFFPELSAIIQPLSGEYAVRREVLESIPFPIGYGVETSHLLDVYTRWGLAAFGQEPVVIEHARDHPKFRSFWSKY